MDKRHILLNSFITIASVALIVSALSISHSPYSNNFQAEANRGSKTLTVESVTETAMTLSNGWSPRITTNNISFGSGLVTIGDGKDGGYIQNIDAFQSIQMLDISASGDIYVQVALSDAYGNPDTFRDAGYFDGEECDVTFPFGKAPQFFKIGSDASATIYNISLKVMCS